MSVSKVASYVPVTHELLEDARSWEAILKREIIDFFDRELFGETWHRGQELELVELGEIRWDDRPYWSCPCDGECPCHSS